MLHSEKSLIMLLDEAGIKRIYNEKPYRRIEFLEYEGKRVGCPTHDRCYETVLREFGVDFTTFND